MSQVASVKLTEKENNVEEKMEKFSLKVSHNEVTRKIKKVNKLLPRANVHYSFQFQAATLEFLMNFQNFPTKTLTSNTRVFPKIFLS